LETLAQILAQRGPEAFLSTVGDKGVHTSHVTIDSLEGDRLTLSVSRGVARNIRIEPQVSLLWPAPARADYSLIINASAEVEDESSKFRAATLKIWKAVLHRPGGTQETAVEACGSDCIRIPVSTT